MIKILWSFLRVIILTFILTNQVYSNEIKVVIASAKKDKIEIYGSDSLATLNQLSKTFPGMGNFISEEFNMSGSFEWDTISFDLDGTALRSMGIKLAWNHPNYGKRVKQNHIKIQSILINSDTNNLEINSSNFIDYFDWNVYVDSISVSGDVIDIFTKEWYYNVHPILYVNSQLKTELSELNSYIELDVKVENSDFLRVYYSEEKDFQFYNNSTIAINGDTAFQKIRVPFYSEDAPRHLKIQLSMLRPNKYYIRSIMIKSGFKNYNFSYNEFKYNFNFNQFCVDKLADIASFRVFTNYSGGIYKPEMTSIKPIVYSDEIFFSKLKDSSKFILFAVILYFFTYLFIKRINIKSTQLNP